jgi:Tfp pilus assembly protein FimT
MDNRELAAKPTRACSPLNNGGRHLAVFRIPKAFCLREEPVPSRRSRATCSNSGRGRRAAFTLVEMLMVLALLVAFAGMTIPSVMRMFNEQKLTAAAERVREAIASARFRAIETGLIYQFCCEANGGRYVVVPFETDHASAKGGTQTGPVVLLPRASGQLSKGISLSSAIVTITTNSATPGATPGSVIGGTTPVAATSHRLPAGSLDGLPNASDLSSANWSTPILFHPEGSANADIVVTVTDTRSQFIKLRVRAFTGAVAMERLVSGKH